MKIVQIFGGKAHWITPWQTFDEMPPFAPETLFVEAPEEVQEGWSYKDGQFAPPLETEPHVAAHTPTDILQTINDLKADLIIAGVI